MADLTPIAPSAPDLHAVNPYTGSVEEADSLREMLVGLMRLGGMTTQLDTELTSDYYFVALLSLAESADETGVRAVAWELARQLAHWHGLIGIDFREVAMPVCPCPRDHQPEYKALSVFGGTAQAGGFLDAVEQAWDVATNRDLGIIPPHSHTTGRLQRLFINHLTNLVRNTVALLTVHIQAEMERDLNEAREANQGS